MTADELQVAAMRALAGMEREHRKAADERTRLFAALVDLLIADGAWQTFCSAREGAELDGDEIAELQGLCAERDAAAAAARDLVAAIASELVE